MPVRPVLCALERPCVVAGCRARGRLDFTVSADPVDPTRVNVYERWADSKDLDAFRATSSDPDDEPVDFSRIRRFEIEQYSVEDRS
jgi:hypothetical protein